jgi:hypothetical protein
MNRGRSTLWMAGAMLLVVAVAVVLFVLGGNNRPVVSDDQIPKPATLPIENAKPTTQELLGGEYKKQPLPGMPLSLKVPVSWKLDSAGSVTMLEGPTPHDHAIIQLAQRDAISPEQLDIFVAGARKDMEQNPESVKRAQLHERTAGGGEFKVLERMSVGSPITTPKLDARGKEMMDAAGNFINVTITQLRWTLLVYVPDPQKKGYARYELNFIGLTTEQYAQDKELLQKIVDSLALESASSGTSATPAVGAM